MNIKLYGAEWCGSCHRIRHYFDSNKITYEYIDIETIPEAEAYIIAINPKGYRSIPVVTILEKSASKLISEEILEEILIEPSYTELKAKLDSYYHNS